MFENRIYSKPTAINEEVLLGNTAEGLKKLSDVPDITRNHARNVAVMSSSCTDFICFMLAAEKNNEKNLCYRLHPPYTIDADKVSMLGQLLVECGVVEDVYYSTVSRSFIIEISEIPKYALSEILLIGIAEKLQSNHGSCAFYNDKIEIYYWDSDRGLLRVKPKFNRTLAFDIAGHKEALLALYKAATKAAKEQSFETMYVVAPEVKRLLPVLPNIIALDEI